MPHPQDVQSLRHQRAVHAFQWNHVAHCCERHEIEKTEEIRLSAAGVETVAAEHARRRHEKQEHDAGRGEVALA